MIAAYARGPFARLERMPRRLDPLSELALLAAAAVVNEPRDCGLYVGCAEGAPAQTRAYLKRLEDKGGHFVNPIDFPNLLLSAPAANVSIHLGLQGAVVTFNQGPLSGFHALAAACEALENGRVKSAIVLELEASDATALRVTKDEAKAGDLVIKEVYLGNAPEGREGTLAHLDEGIVRTVSEEHGVAGVRLERR